MDLGATGEEAKAAYDNLTNLWTRASTEDLGKRMALVEHSRQKRVHKIRQSLTPRKI